MSILHIHVYIYMYICTCIYTHTLLYVYLYISYTDAPTISILHIHVYIYIYIYTYLYIHTLLYVYLHIYTYTSICILTYIIYRCPIHEHPAHSERRHWRASAPARTAPRARGGGCQGAMELDAPGTHSQKSS